MNSRRGFFKRIAQAAAIIALAPQIAFKSPAPKLDLDLDAFFRQVYSIRSTNEIDIYCDRLTAQRIQHAMTQYYKEQYAA